MNFLKAKSYKIALNEDIPMVQDTSTITVNTGMWLKETADAEEGDLPAIIRPGSNPPFNLTNVPAMEFPAVGEYELTLFGFDSNDSAGVMNYCLDEWITDGCDIESNTGHTSPNTIGDFTVRIITYVENAAVQFGKLYNWATTNPTVNVIWDLVKIIAPAAITAAGLLLKRQARINRYVPRNKQIQSHSTKTGNEKSKAVYVPSGYTQTIVMLYNQLALANHKATILEKANVPQYLYGGFSASNYIVFSAGGTYPAARLLGTDPVDVSPNGTMTDSGVTNRWTPVGQGKFLLRLTSVGAISPFAVPSGPGASQSIIAQTTTLFVSIVFIDPATATDATYVNIQCTGASASTSTFEASFLADDW